MVEMPSLRRLLLGASMTTAVTGTCRTLNFTDFCSENSNLLFVDVYDEVGTFASATGDMVIESVHDQYVLLRCVTCLV